MLIASRVLTLVEGERTIELPVRIFAPERSRTGSWFCRDEVDWPGEQHKMKMGGADSVQALVAALYAIGAEIYSSNYHRQATLYLDKRAKVMLSRSCRRIAICCEATPSISEESHHHCHPHRDGRDKPGHDSHACSSS
jgi:hypothetical protein